MSKARGQRIAVPCYWGVVCPVSARGIAPCRVPARSSGPGRSPLAVAVGRLPLPWFVNFRIRNAHPAVAHARLLDATRARSWRWGAETRNCTSHDV
jgi:hypothetical protein